jgi:hypothetical protein
VRELRPKDDPGIGNFPPYCTGGLHTRKLGHLNIEDRKAWTIFYRKLYSHLAIGGLYQGKVRGKISREQIHKIAALGFVVFGDQYRHRFIEKGYRKMLWP